MAGDLLQASYVRWSLGRKCLVSKYLMFYFLYYLLPHVLLKNTIIFILTIM
jgi:hypothetical protein